MMRPFLNFICTLVMLIPCLVSPVAAAKYKGAAHKSVASAPMPESRDHTLWKLRSALNVAALQCQFDPSLKAIDNYKQFLNSHKVVLEEARSALTSRMGINAFDHYSTQQVNNFSSVDDQLVFCNKAAVAATEANAAGDSDLIKIAESRVPEMQIAVHTHAILKLKTALNMAALQCKTIPALKIDKRYEEFATTHKPVLETVENSLKASMTAANFDRYVTELTNQYSITNSQPIFCRKAASVLTEANASNAVKLAMVAENRVPEIQIALATKAATSVVRKTRGKRRHA